MHVLSFPCIDRSRALSVGDFSGPHGYGHFFNMAPVPILAQDREEQMVLPFPFDAQVLPGATLLLETGSYQQRAARGVVWQASGLDPMEAKPLEGEAQDERKCRRHEAPLSEGLTDPIAEAGSLGHAAPQIGEADSADQCFVLGEDEQVVGLVGPPVFGIAGHPGTEARPTQRVDGPAWLSWREKISGTAAQARPVLVIAALGRTQKDTLAGQAKRLRAGEKDAGEGFALRGHRHRNIKRRSDL